jgi:catechol 2,3-dioxygenase-like lactoylglutathione lyase family enzyme
VDSIDEESEVRTMDDLGEIRLELVVLPVTDVDRAKAFYADRFGFHVDYDHRVSDTLRFVQLTPPGSACSIAIGEGLTDAVPGSVRGMQVVVPDIEVTRRGLIARGLDPGEVQDMEWGRFLFLTDPDGNLWSIQQIVRRSASPAS